MGGVSFETEYRGSGTMEEAYRALVEQAFYEQGHDPYNGTISTTSGCVQDPAVKEPVTIAEAMAHLYPERHGREGQDWWDKDDGPRKWEEAWAIPLKPTPPEEVGEAYPWGPPHDVTQPGWLFYGIAAC